MSNEAPTSRIETQADAIIYFLQKLDVEMVGEILEDNRTYQDFEKYIFINKLDCALDEFIQAGDTFLDRYEGFCNDKTCNYKCKGFTFIGNNSGHYIDLIIDIKNGIIQDMYECILFKCGDENLSKNIRIKIDKFDFLI